MVTVNAGCYFRVLADRQITAGVELAFKAAVNAEIDRVLERNSALHACVNIKDLLLNFCIFLRHKISLLLSRLNGRIV